MAWMRMMGAESVNYHRETVLGRADDHPGAALDYYASRGETPLVWGGSGARDLGLAGAVTEAQYDAIFGPGGARDPANGTRLVNAKRPGMELVVAAHKSVALLGLVGRAEDMHAILDTETDATLAYLDAWMTARGGRRGRSQTRVPTNGLLWARTRHATSRAGDPEPHDHILIANLCHISDDKGGWKALDTAALRDILHAATAFGRVASAAKAVELGYAIEARRRTVGTARPLAHRRHARGGLRAVLQALGGDHRRGRVTRATTPTRPARWRPETPARPSATPRRLISWPGWLAELVGRRLQPRRPPRRVEKAAAGRGQDRPAVLTEPPVVSPGRLPARPVRAARRPEGVHPSRRRRGRRAAAVRLRPPRAPPGRSRRSAPTPMPSRSWASRRPGSRPTLRRVSSPTRPPSPSRRPFKPSAGTPPP